MKKKLFNHRGLDKTRTKLALGLFLAWAILLHTASASGTAVGPLSGMIECQVSGIQFEGIILTWTSSEIIMLSRDGSVKRIPRALASDFRTTSDTLVPLPVHAVRSQLQREFGPEYRVVSTTHYLVVEPADATTQWSPVFESVFREAWQFAAQRKLPVTKPVFALVAVVYRDRKAFENSPEVRRCKSYSSQVLGLYDPLSNRCLTFGQQAFSKSVGSAVTLESTKNVLRHEAFHQFAANTGLQGRFTDTPSWLAEGMAMMFESGPWDVAKLRSSDPDESLRKITVQMLSQLPSGWLQNIVGSDSLFELQPRNAYLASWATVCYLSDRQLSQFVTYLRYIQKQPPFQSYSSAARIKDFEASFGRSWEKLERNILQYINR